VIEIGPAEDRDNNPMLLIKFYDTMQQHVPNARYGDPMIPIYGIAFTAQEMRDLTANVVENAKTMGTLIHREPQGDIEPDEPAYMEVHWLVEGGKITGIRAAIKPTQVCYDLFWSEFYHKRMRSLTSKCRMRIPPWSCCDGK
jgi:hypothetical protein